MSEAIKDLNDVTFESVLSSAQGPVLVDFWAPWCGACRKLAPELDAAAKEAHGKAIVCKLNVDEYSDVADKFGVQSIPTMILFKDAKPQMRMVGFRDKNAILESIFNGTS